MISLGQLNLVTTGLQVGSSLLSGYTDKANAKIQANQLEWEAGQAAESGRTQAAKVRRKGEFEKGQTVVDIQSSGFTSEGYDQLLLEQYKGIENDVFQTVLSGDVEAISRRLSADLTKIQGKTQMQMGVVNALGAVAGGYMRGAAMKEAGVSGKPAGMKNASLLGMFR
jgi:FlaG/FlaF family flagellin (archaellin)